MSWPTGGCSVETCLRYLLKARRARKLHTPMMQGWSLESYSIARTLQTHATASRVLYNSAWAATQHYPRITASCTCANWYISLVPSRTLVFYVCTISASDGYRGSLGAQVFASFVVGVRA